MACERLAAPAAVAWASRGLDVHARGHDVLRGQLRSGAGCARTARPSPLFQGALGGRVLGQGDQFLGAAGGLPAPRPGSRAEAAYEAVRRVVQVPDEGAERGGEAALRAPRRPSRRGQRGTAQFFGPGSPTTHQDDAWRRPRRARSPPWTRQRPGRSPAAGPRSSTKEGTARVSSADDQRGHGDAELGAGELEAPGTVRNAWRRRRRAHSDSAARSRSPRSTVVRENWVATKRRRLGGGGGGRVQEGTSVTVPPASSLHTV